MIVKKQRPGFTLIELLVVCSIIIALMAVVISVYPGHSNREQLFRASDLIKNNIARARQWAIRDNAPTGIMFGSLKAGGLGTTLTFIQGQPLIPGQVGVLEFEMASPPSAKIAKISAGRGSMFLKDALATGPYYVLSNGKANRVVSVSGDNIEFANDHGFPLLIATDRFSDFILVRSPKPLSGEPVIEFFTDKPTIRTTITKPPSTAPISAIVFNNKGQVEDFTSGHLALYVEQTEPDESSTGGFKTVEEAYIYLDVISGLTRIK